MIGFVVSFEAIILLNRIFRYKHLGIFYKRYVKNVSTTYDMSVVKESKVDNRTVTTSFAHLHENRHCAL